jgi:hypothetical protein
VPRTRQAHARERPVCTRVRRADTRARLAP